MSVAIHFVEERVFKMGSQENESATEKTIDNRIESAILSGYKSVSGKCFPIADSDLRPGSQAKYKNTEFIATERKWYIANTLKNSLHVISIAYTKHRLIEKYQLLRLSTFNPIYLGTPLL